MSTIALVGLPNSGKSSLFNAVTKNKQRVANFPGITVEKKTGKANFEGKVFEFVDLPGVYTLDATSLDEKITRDYIFDKIKDHKADTFILVVDATNLKKSLYLALQLKEIGQKFIIALNMIDIAKQRSLELDKDALSAYFGDVPVVETVAKDSKGVEDILKAVASLEKPDQKINIPNDYQKQIKDLTYVKNKLSEVETLLKSVVIKEIAKDTLTEKVDKWLMNPILGPFLLIAILILVFQLLFSWSDPFIGYIETFFEFLGETISNLLPDGYLKSMLVDGIIAGVGGVLVFLPHIIFLFIIINFLEGIGYLGRAAFLLDYIMRRLGLPGKAVVPMLSSHACAIPGIMSARIIENPTQRLITMMVSPLTACSARLPVYTLLIAVIVPNETFMGLGLPGLVLTGLYIFGIISAFIIAWIAKKTMLPSSPSYLMMELPPYRMPNLLSVLRSALQKGMLFVKKAGTIILVLSVIIWGLVTFPGAPDNAELPEIHYSYAAKIGKTFEPVFRPMGFDWKITTALIPSFGAREVLVAALGTVYAVEGDDPEDEGFISSLSETLTSEYSLGTLMALLIWFVFSPQCISTIGVLRKETNSYKMPAIFFIYTLALAYLVSWLTYIIFT